MTVELEVGTLRRRFSDGQRNRVAGRDQHRQKGVDMKVLWLTQEEQ